MTCPECDGAKQNTALVCGVRDGRRFCDQRNLTCGTCGGTGVITEEQAARIKEGRRLRNDRVARGVSQREEAARLGITPQELSKREAGRI